MEKVHLPVIDDAAGTLLDPKAVRAFPAATDELGASIGTAALAGFVPHRDHRPARPASDPAEHNPRRSEGGR